MASDAELIGWSLAGDDDAFVEVICHHEAAVWAYLVRRAGRGSAEDLLGEVWANAFGSRELYDRSYADARPWLFGIAHNTLRHHWRSRPLEDPVSDIGDQLIGADPWPAVDERIDVETILRSALTHLRSKEREVLLLVVWEELTIADAARVLNVPAGTARRYLHQARMTLRDAPGVTTLLTELTLQRRSGDR